MTLNKDLTKKYRKILKSMPSFSATGWNQNDAWEITITGFRVYENGGGGVNRHYEIDIQYKGTFKWAWASTRSKNSTVKNAVESTLKRYLKYLGIEPWFNSNPNFYHNTAKIKKITKAS